MRPVHNHLSDAAFRRFTFIAPVSVDPPRRPQLTSEEVREHLFEGLDGQSISVGTRTWQIRIYSICGERAAWWLQLHLEGDPEYTVTMRTPCFHTAHETLHRLASWLTGSHADDTLTVA